jgi:hypothetical protein
MERRELPLETSRLRSSSAGPQIFHGQTLVAQHDIEASHHCRYNKTMRYRIAASGKEFRNSLSTKGKTRGKLVETAQQSKQLEFLQLAVGFLLKLSSVFCILDIPHRQDEVARVVGLSGSFDVLVEQRCQQDSEEMALSLSEAHVCSAQITPAPSKHERRRHTHIAHSWR